MCGLRDEAGLSGSADRQTARKVGLELDSTGAKGRGYFNSLTVRGPASRARALALRGVPCSMSGQLWDF